MPNNTSVPPPSTSIPPSATPSQIPSSVVLGDADEELRHPRGRIAPRLPRDAPFYKRFVRAVVRLVQGLHYHRAMRTAPAMAFHFFLSLLPAFVFIGFIVGAIARRRGVNAIMAPLIDNMPETTEVIVKNQLGRLAGADAHRLGPLAAVGFLWVASSGVHGLMDAVEFTVGARPRKWWKQRLLSIGWVIGSIAAVGVASFGIIQWDDIVHAGAAPPIATAAPSASVVPSATVAPSSSITWTANDPAKPERDEPPPEPEAIASAAKKPVKVEPPKGGISPRAIEPDLSDKTILPPKPSAATASASASSNPVTGAAPEGAKQPRRSRVRILRTEGERILALVLSLAGAVGGLAAFYRFSVSHSKRVKRRVLPGALLAVGLWIVVTWAFGFYVKTLANYAAFYGSLAAVAVLLVWLWLVSLSILVGAELNSQVEGLRD